MKVNINLCAIIVAYYPDLEFNTRLSSILSQVDRVYVIDNTDGGKNTFISHNSMVTHVKLLTNRGVAEALNIGAKMALRDGYKIAVTFDQDSKINNGFINELYKTYLNHKNENVALVGSSFIDPVDLSESIKIPIFKKLWYKKIVPKSDMEIDMTITSGCLTDLSKLESLGMFNENLFIDYVDTELCLRCKELGYKVFFCTKAKMVHSIGSISKSKGLKVKTSNHAALRRYYIARNSIYMYKKYAMRNIGWFAFDIIDNIKNLIKIILMEDNKSKKISMYFKGIKDGFSGVTGKIKKSEC